MGTVKLPLAVRGCASRLDSSRLGCGWSVHVRVAVDAEPAHVAPIVTIRMPMGQVVMSFLRRVLPASLTNWVAVEEQAVPLLP